MPVLIILLALYLVAGFRVVIEYERALYFTFGRFSGIKKPGLRYIFPGIQRMRKVDVRVITQDIPKQDCITRDNVTVKVDAVLYYKVSDVEKCILEVENYKIAVSELAQTTMRNIVGQFELDGLLQKREEICENIRELVDKATDPWGISVEYIEIKDILLPDSLKRMISRAAEAEREKKAVIIKSEGEVTASENLKKAAETLSSSSGALHLRTLHTLNDLAASETNTMLFALPLEILKAFENSKS